jgi:homogentisate 1,2-dioxygenase
MPIYHQLGTIPNKRHVVSRQTNGNLYQEELVGTQGFAGMSSLVYHLYPPTRVKQKDKAYSVEPKVAMSHSLDAMSFQGFQIQPEQDFIKSRKTLICKCRLCILAWQPLMENLPPIFIKNADADEMIFIHEGSGTLY